MLGCGSTPRQLAACPHQKPLSVEPRAVFEAFTDVAENARTKNVCLRLSNNVPNTKMEKNPIIQPQSHRNDSYKMAFRYY